jgi:outer membrane protein assembly factor BamB
MNNSGAIAGDQFIVGNGDGNVYSLSRDSGDMLWSEDIGRTATGVTVADGTAYVGRSGYGEMNALDIESGAVNWTYECEGGIQSNVSKPPAVTEDKVIFGSSNSYVIAVDREEGTEVWIYDTGEPGTLSNSSGNSRAQGYPAVANEMVYAANKLGEVVAVDLSDGSEVWTYETGAAVNTSPSVDGDNIYVGDSEGTFHAFDMDTGDLQWTYDTSSNIGDSSPVSTAESVLFGNDDGEIYSLDSSSGELNWSYQASGSISPVAITDEMLFAGSEEGEIYALTFE